MNFNLDRLARQVWALAGGLMYIFLLMAIPTALGMSFGAVIVFLFMAFFLTVPLIDLALAWIDRGAV